MRQQLQESQSHVERLAALVQAQEDKMRHLKEGFRVAQAAKVRTVSKIYVIIVSYQLFSCLCL